MLLIENNFDYNILTPIENDYGYNRSGFFDKQNNNILKDMPDTLIQYA